VCNVSSYLVSYACSRGFCEFDDGFFVLIEAFGEFVWKTLDEYLAIRLICSV